MFLLTIVWVSVYHTMWQHVNRITIFLLPTKTTSNLTSTVLFLHHDNRRQVVLTESIEGKKGNAHHRRDHEGPDRKQRYSA